jgi:YHS domain-containing protein
MRDLLATSQGPRVATEGHRDPVCGMAITDLSTAMKLPYGGLDFFFCSEGCRLRFEIAPQRYVDGRRGTYSRPLIPWWRAWGRRLMRSLNGLMRNGRGRAA